MRLFQVNKETIWFLIAALTISFFLDLGAVAVAVHWNGKYHDLEADVKTAKQDFRLHAHGQRFEVLARGGGCVDLTQYPNYKPEDNLDCIDRKTRLWDIEVLRDMQSGVEFICAYHDHEMSCFASGRLLK